MEQEEGLWVELVYCGFVSIWSGLLWVEEELDLNGGRVLEWYAMKWPIS